MTFNDIFKSSFLESVSTFSVLDVLIGMLVSLAVGLFIFLVYKKTFTGVMYSSGFALTLVGLSLVTTLVIMAVTSNVVLSLGMVGAVDCALPRGNQGAYRNCIFVLGYCVRDRHRCGYDSTCGHRLRYNRGHPYRLCKSKNT